jgi:hypothetical protein
VVLTSPSGVQPGGQKLSKSAGDTGVRELHRSGLRPADVIGRAAAAVGLVAAGTPVTAKDVEALFCDRPVAADLR